MSQGYYRYYIGILLGVFVVIGSSNTFGQVDFTQKENNGYCVSIIPHYLLVRTLKIEVDLQIANTNNWLVTSFAYAHRDSDLAWSFDFNIFRTYGGAIGYRYYFFGKGNPKWLYAQTDVVFNYSLISVDSYYWGETTYNGASAYTRSQGVHDDKMYQHGGNMKVGCMIKANRYIFFDFYVGVGYRHSEVTTPFLSYKYDNEILSPAYTGFLPLTGVRFGVNF